MQFCIKIFLFLKSVRSGILFSISLIFVLQLDFLINPLLSSFLSTSLIFFCLDFVCQHQRMLYELKRQKQELSFSVRKLFEFNYCLFKKVISYNIIMSPQINRNSLYLVISNLSTLVFKLLKQVMTVFKFLISNSLTLDSGVIKSTFLVNVNMSPLPTFLHHIFLLHNQIKFNLIQSNYHQKSYMALGSIDS